MSSPQRGPSTLGTADVWHQGSRSFYRAKLLKKLTITEASFDPTDPESAGPSRQELYRYIAAYVNEELSRGHQITEGIITSAFDAFEGGAR